MQAAFKYTEAERRAELWSRGLLKWKLYGYQHPLYDLLYDVRSSRNKKAFTRTNRRHGKTHVYLTFGIERCIQEENILIPFVAPALKHLRNIIRPIMNEITRDCPKRIRPVYRVQESAYFFPTTGSQLLLGAAENNHAEKFRGIKAKYALVDECGVISDLRMLVNDILMPALMYGGGEEFLAGSGTPPKTPDHYYVELAAECEANGTGIHRTIWDTERLAVQEILEFAEEAGCIVDWQRFTDEHGPETAHDMDWGHGLIRSKSSTWRREYEAEILIDEESAVVPEFTEDRQAALVTDWERPPYFHPYTVLDTGFIDFTAVVFGYYDFLKGVVVVEDDLLIDFRREGMNARLLAERILEKEQELWGRKAHLRFGDGDLIVLHELDTHGCVVNNVTKDHLEAQVNQVRLDITSGRVRINPRAKNVIAHTSYAVWNKRRTQFARTENSGHFDALAALIYFLRHINRNDNPYPRYYQVNKEQMHVPDGYGQDRMDAVKKIFGG